MEQQTESTVFLIRQQRSPFNCTNWKKLCGAGLVNYLTECVDEKVAIPECPPKLDRTIRVWI